MPENQRCFSLPRQKRALLALEWAVGFQPAGSVWVLLLAARGWSLVEIGLAEGLFHVVSLCCELPSGLLAGVTVWLGWRAAYLLDAGVALLGLAAALRLGEPVCQGREKTVRRSLPAALGETVRGAWTLLKTDRTAVGLMLVNALVGACATLTRFFLQQRVEAAVTVPALLGPALFVLGLGGALAGLLAVGLDRLAYARAALLAGAGTALCAGLARGSFLPVLMASGLAAGLLDDALQLVSDKRLNDRFPSAQRATLVSVSSMAFSLFMIPLSPLFGMLFT